jgi:hypothetical protein
VFDAEKYRQDDYFNAKPLDSQSNETSSSLLQTDNPFLSDQLKRPGSIDELGDYMKTQKKRKNNDKY